jgi:hypothetical protein
MEPCLSKQSYMRVPEGQCAHWWIASIVALPLGSGLRGLTLWARGARCHPGLFSALMAGRVAQVAGGTARRGKDIRGGRPCEAVQARAPEGLVLAWARRCVNCEAEPAGVHGAQLLVCARAFLAAPPGVPLAMLQGPPGSGKTTTGAVLARALANFARERGTALATLHVAQTIAEARKLLQVCHHLVIDEPGTPSLCAWWAYRRRVARARARVLTMTRHTAALRIRVVCVCCRCTGSAGKAGGRCSGASVDGGSRLPS